MATPQWDEQFKLNMETIARFSGFGPLPDMSTPAEQPEGKCEICGQMVPTIELDRNHNACDDCIITGRAK